MNTGTSYDLDEIVKAELYQMTVLYERTDDLVAMLNLMHPNNLVDIINNAACKLSEVGIVIFKNKYSNHYDYMNNESKLRNMPSIDMEKKLLGYIVTESDSINMVIENFKSNYLGMVEYIEKSNDNDRCRSLGGTILGGTLAGMAFGPIGAIIGGIAAGSFVGDKARLYTQEELNTHMQSLTAEFCNTLKDINTFIDEMTDRLIEATNSYEGMLSR